MFLFIIAIEFFFVIKLSLQASSLVIARRQCSSADEAISSLWFCPSLSCERSKECGNCLYNLRRCKDPTQYSTWKHLKFFCFAFVGKLEKRYLSPSNKGKVRNGLVHLFDIRDCHGCERKNHGISITERTLQITLNLFRISSFFILLFISILFI